MALSDHLELCMGTILHDSNTLAVSLIQGRQNHFQGGEAKYPLCPYLEKSLSYIATCQNKTQDQ